MSQPLTAFLYNTGFVSYKSAEDIAIHFKQKDLMKGEHLMKAGQVANDYYFLESGFLRSYAHDVQGNEVTTAFHSAGQIIFEVSSFFNRVPGKENIQALSNCSGLSITYLELNNLFHAMPEFREFGRAMLVKGFTGLKTRMLAMITETAEERYAHLLNSNPEILQNAPLKNIASYLGITDTSLSRIRKDFAKK